MQRLWDARIRLGVPPRSLSNPYHSITKRVNLEDGGLAGEYGGLGLKSRSSSPSPRTFHEHSIGREDGLNVNRYRGYSEQYLEHGMERRDGSGSSNSSYPSNSTHQQSSSRASGSRITSCPLPSNSGQSAKSRNPSTSSGDSKSNETSGGGTVSPLTLEYSPPVGFNSSSIPQSHSLSTSNPIKQASSGRPHAEHALLEDHLLSAATDALNLHAKRMKKQSAIEGKKSAGVKLSVQERRARRANEAVENKPKEKPRPQLETSTVSIKPPANSHAQPRLSLTSCQKVSRSDSSTTHTYSDNSTISPTSSLFSSLLLPSLSLSSSSTSVTSSNPVKQSNTSPGQNGRLLPPPSRLTLALKSLPKVVDEVGEVEIEREARNRANRKAILAWTGGWNEWEWNDEVGKREVAGVVGNANPFGIAFGGVEDQVVQDDDEDASLEYQSPSSTLFFNGPFSSEEPTYSSLRRQSEAPIQLTRSNAYNSFEVLMTTSKSYDTLGLTLGSTPTENENLVNLEGSALGLGLGGINSMGKEKAAEQEKSKKKSNFGKWNRVSSSGLERSSLRLPTNSTPAWLCQDFCCWEPSDAKSLLTSSSASKKKKRGL